jgi:branched-chain amino acid transport system ATP-binding protein
MREYSAPSVGGTPALEVAAMTSGYGALMVLRDIHLSVASGSVVAILGKNGMGKTTLLKSILGFLPKQSGQILLSGQDITSMPAYRVARQSVSYTPQEQALFADLTIKDNLRLGVSHDSLLADRLTAVHEIFPFLKDRMEQLAGTLSGGEQKMLLIARALLGRPQLMLIDEITEGLQPSVIQRVANALNTERQRHGTSMLIVEQNVEFALQVADHYIVLKRGEVVLTGRTREAGALAAIEAELTM